MSYLLQIDLDEPVPVASVRGWADFGEWVDTLPVQEAEATLHLLEYGWTPDTDELFLELRAALRRQLAPDVRTTAEGIVAALEQAGDAEVVTVTDGLGPDRDRFGFAWPGWSKQGWSPREVDVELAELVPAAQERERPAYPALAEAVDACNEDVSALCRAMVANIARAMEQEGG